MLNIVRQKLNVDYLIVRQASRHACCCLLLSTSIALKQNWNCAPAPCHWLVNKKAISENLIMSFEAARKSGLYVKTLEAVERLLKCRIFLSHYLQNNDPLSISLTRSLPHSLAHSLTHSHTHSLTHSHSQSVTHSLTHSLTNSLFYTFILCCH
jgi:hypothetical protein